MRCGSDIGKRCVATEYDGKGRKRVSPDTDGHPNKPGHLSNLGNSLLGRFECLGDIGGIDKSISVGEDAVQLTPDGHPDKPGRLNNLGNSFLSCFKCLADIADIEKSILMKEDAVQLTPDSHPDKPMYLYNLGTSFLCHFEHLGDSPTLDQAIFHFTSAACSSTGTASIRFKASSMWAQCAWLSQHSSLLEAYKLALDLLPKLAWLGLPIHDRHHGLNFCGNVVNDAAAAAIKFGEYGTAIEWLEQGRSIVWGELLQLRTPVDELHKQSPALAAHLSQLSKELEQTSARDDLQVVDGCNQQSLEKVAQRHHQLALEWEELVKEVRMMPSFERFLLPKTLSQLQFAAHSGPVVVLNTSKIQCDALILMPDLDDVLHLPLPDFTFKQAQELQHSLKFVLDNGRAAKLVHIDGQPRDINTEFEKILSKLWLHVVKPVLDILAFTVCHSYPLCS